MDHALQITLIQDNPVTGDVAGNLELALSHIKAENGADLIVFSECFLTGYPVADLALRPGFIQLVNAAVQELRREIMALEGPAVIIGALQAGANLPYNSALLIEPDGAVRMVYKTELPNSDVFDERRTFASSKEDTPGPISFRGYRLGLQICEDMWHGAVSRSLAAEMADVLLVINGSPYQVGKHAQRVDIARRRSRETSLPLIYVNQVGGQDELVFDGASFVMNVDCPPLTAKAFEADKMHITLRRSEGGEAIIGLRDDQEAHFTPYPLDDLEADWRACVLGLRDYIAKTGAARVMLGVSGGLDSAIVLAMAADAIGPERVIGVMMPSAHTSKESLDLADDLMARLKVHARRVDIAPIFDVISPAMAGMSGGLAKDLKVVANNGIADENYQARIRGMCLMGLSNSLNGIVLSTGNKSEMSVGYCTLYGDMAGGYNPLKSVYKSRAFKMAAWRNKIDPAAFGLLGAADPIPVQIINRPPSAELAEGQTDEAKLGSYELLDHVLHGLIEERRDADSVAKTALRHFGGHAFARHANWMEAHDYCKMIAQLVRKAQFKRAQACPGVKLNATDFGLGWRYPIAGKYEL